jgi:NADH dehydrogenase
MILVVGATGRVGGRIAHRLLADGRPVRVLIRPGSDHQSLIDAGAEPVIGDLKDPASLRAACDGMKSIITTANAAGRGGDDTLDTVDDQGNRNLIEAATEAAVERFVFTSVLGSDPNSPAPLVRAKGMSEERLRASGMVYTITQADVHMDLMIPLVVGAPMSRGEPVRVVGEGRRKHSFVAQQDVAAFTVAALEHPAAKNQTIQLGGPESMSWREIVRTVEAQLDQSLQIESVPIGERISNLPDFVTDLVTMLEMYDSAVEMRETASLFGVEPTPLSTWVRQTFAQAPASMSAS